MNTANIKSYAPKARREFIQAVTEKAHLLGLSEDHIEPVEIKGDVAIIAGRPYPKQVGQIRQELESRIKKDGFELTMRSMAYTWFNRFVAIRYMELHDYLDHGFRILSNRAGSEIPEILEHATDIDLPGLNREEVIRLRLAGDKDNELYQLLVVAQCNALSRAMPFLFERIGGSDELLMPDNLLHSNSPVRNLVNEIPEKDWRQIEVIGWIYQFYISDKKGEVIGKVVASIDIPAATQLFTPNWIVKYMVQNSLGAQWLATYPHSPLREQMEYYIEPADQTDEVKHQLAAITPDSLNPEDLTLIDSACGSGHILVEAYELFKEIYLERGYRLRDVAKLILEKNLFGLDIDRRAAQLTGFSLMMKGRTDDRRLFERDVKLNVAALVDSAGFDADGLAKGVDLGEYGLQPDDLTELKQLFEHASTFGSLIQVPEGLANNLLAFKKLCETTSHDLFVSDALKRLCPLVQQAELLAAQYDAVVANPPYMGRKYLNKELKRFASRYYEASQADLYAMFIERNIQFCRCGRFVGMIAMDSWLYGEDFKDTRSYFLDRSAFVSLCHLGPHAFPEIKGEVVQTATFIGIVRTTSQLHGVFFDLVDEKNSESKASKLLRGEGKHTVANSDFKKVPREVFTAYRASDAVLKAFETSIPLKEISEALTGLQTGDNPRFIRYWFELAFTDLSFDNSSQEEALESGKKWFPYVKGSDYRKWYGNQSCVVNWGNDGAEIRVHASATVRNAHKYFHSGIAYNNISKNFCARQVSPGFIFDQKNSMFFSDSYEHELLTLGLLHSDAIQPFFEILSPKDFNPGALKIIPVPQVLMTSAHITESIESLVRIHRDDWDSFEVSWDFTASPLLATASSPPTIVSRLEAIEEQANAIIAKVHSLEEENNRLFIDVYGLQNELTPNIPIEQITLTGNPAYRYSGKLTKVEQWTRFRQDTMKELLSYAMGCMMGRYSMDKPGLIYAHKGNELFDPGSYTTFPADDDGIIPLTDTEWFDDDACNRIIEFILVAWGAEGLEDNLTFLAENLSPKRNEPSRDTIRRYLCDSFFKNHLQTYKNRPIYWLFSSGKQKAFQCLVYLHRHNESTLSRIRSAYVTPLFGNFNARLEYLENEKKAADTASTKKKFQKEIDDVKKKLTELSAFDDELRHYADQRISLDLDDGVKVNYGKFGNLLTEKKTVTG